MTNKHTEYELVRLTEINAELLEALKNAVSFVGLFPDVRSQVEAAIAKATGQALQDLADIGQELNI